jgi:hypothetical protein
MRQLISKALNRQLSRFGLHVSREATFTQLLSNSTEAERLRVRLEQIDWNYDFTQAGPHKVLEKVPDDLLAVALARHQGQPGWAMHLPKDGSTFHVGGSDKARRFQSLFHTTNQFAGWSVSHMCLSQVIRYLGWDGVKRYLEIGVAEGLSLYALITALRLVRILRKQPLAGPLFEELVLADMWGKLYGGTGRGSPDHIVSLLQSVGVDPAQVVFLNGDSKQTVPALLRQRNDTTPFDVVYVDGDHSYQGAETDLENVLPYVGKALFFDDMYHPAHCLQDRLLDLHRALVERLKEDFYCFINRQWFGFAAFIRKAVFESLAF